MGSWLTALPWPSQTTRVPPPKKLLEVPLRLPRQPCSSITFAPFTCCLRSPGCLHLFVALSLIESPLRSRRFNLPLWEAIIPSLSPWSLSVQDLFPCPRVHNAVLLTLPFDEFIKRAAEKKHSDFFLCEESYYLRSLVEEIRKEPSDLRKHFPDLAEDFHIPEFFEPAQFFSSVFRISLCGLQLWTHYNVSEGLCERRAREGKDCPFHDLAITVDNSISQPLSALVSALFSTGAIHCRKVVCTSCTTVTSVQYPHSPSALCYKDPYGNKNPVAPAWAFQALERDFYGCRMGQSCAYSSFFVNSEAASP
uniref:tRNA-yW synthesizing protein 5 n=1 Tax=Salmo trutta TaxID=8032 RepID=A0A673Y687_SALTR